MWRPWPGCRSGYDSDGRTMEAEGGRRGQQPADETRAGGNCSGVATNDKLRLHVSVRCAKEKARKFTPKVPFQVLFQADVIVIAGLAGHSTGKVVNERSPYNLVRRVAAYLLYYTYFLLLPLEIRAYSYAQYVCNNPDTVFL